MPTRWLFTDERLGGDRPGDALWQAVARLPRGSGIIFRHYGWKPGKRARLLAKLEALARRRGLVVVCSDISRARGGVHRPRGSRARTGRGLVTASAHSQREMLQAFQRGADLVFLSPVFPTASHPGARVLGAVKFGLIASHAPGPVLALGGMGAGNARRMQALGAAGYGAIDDWLRA